VSRESVLALGRAAAEAGMSDACTITRVTGTSTDRRTGAPSETTTTIYSGPCRVQELFGFARETSPAPDQTQLARYRILQLPVVTSGGVRAGDEVVIDSAVNDPDLVGVAMRVRDQSAKSEATARRIGIEEITS